MPRAPTSPVRRGSDHLGDHAAASKRPHPGLKRVDTVAIEPLRHQESNIINTSLEGLAWVNAVNDPNIQLMIDFYHFSVEKEDPSDILKVKDHLRHLHMANPNGRVMPRNWDEYNYTPFFATLRQIHYDRLISLEASTKDLPADGPPAIALLNRAFGQ